MVLMKILISATKGGTGKTTTSVFLTDVLHRRGHKVALIDADYEQRSAANAWCQNFEPGWACYPGDEIPDEFDDQDYDYVIIDSAPGERARLVTLLALVDAIVIPAKPELGDLFATTEVVELAARHATLAPPPVVLLSRVDLRSVPQVVECRTWLAENSIPAFQTIIPQRVDIHRAFLSEPGSSRSGMVAYGEFANELLARLA